MSRDYKKEYADYHSKPDQLKNRASRNKARKVMERMGCCKKGDGKDVDHQDGNPKNNSKGNLKVMSASENRSKK